MEASCSVSFEYRPCQSGLMWQQVRDLVNDLADGLDSKPDQFIEIDRFIVQAINILHDDIHEALIRNIGMQDICDLYQDFDKEMKSVSKEPAENNGISSPDSPTGTLAVVFKFSYDVERGHSYSNIQDDVIKWGYDMDSFISYAIEKHYLGIKEGIDNYNKGYKMSTWHTQQPLTGDDEVDRVIKLFNEEAARVSTEMMAEKPNANDK